MPNHFHIIVKSHRSDLWEKGINPITEFLRKLSTSYVMYFNKKYNRTGSLFEGKFKSKYVSKENYFYYLFAYIHLNPIKLFQSTWKEEGVKSKEQGVEFLKNYKFSSFQEFFGSKRKESKILTKSSLPDDFKLNSANELFEWFSKSPQV